jgi:hypothetical protein
LILLAIILLIVLLLFGLYKLFYTFTRSTIGGIAGAIITILIFYSLLTNGSSIKKISFSTVFYILLFIFFISIFIYGYKASQSSDIKKLKKIIYHIQTPQDAIKLRNALSSMVNKFDQSIKQITNNITNSVNILQNNYLNKQVSPQNINITYLISLLGYIKNNIKNFINEYQQYKTDLDRIEASINGLYKEPLRSYLLKILEKEGKKKIKDKAEAAYKDYLQICRPLLINRSNIKNLALNQNNKQKIDKILNDIDSYLSSFQI